MSVSLAASVGAFYQSFLNGGIPNALGTIDTFLTNTTTPQPTFTSATGLVANSNPIVLGPDGRVPFEIFLTDSVAYTFVLKDAAGNTLKTQNDIVGIGSAGTTLTTALAAPSGASLVGFQQAGVGAVPITLQANDREIVMVTQFFANGVNGAPVDPTGALDSTLGIQAAINSFGGNPGMVFFPCGTYKVTSQITVSSNRMHIVGCGMWATNIVFAPTADGTCFKFENGVTVLYQGSLRCMAITTADVTHNKVAINIIDTSGYRLDDIAVHLWNGGANGSIAVLVQGRELGCCCDWYIDADRPLVIDQIPAAHGGGPSAEAIDHFNFHNMLLNGGTLYPVVTVKSGVVLTQVSFTGYQAWVGGTDGFNWIDTTSTAQSNGLVFENVRVETSSDPTKYAFNIQMNLGLQDLLFKSGQIGTRNGYSLHRVTCVSWHNTFYSLGTGVGLSVDATVSGMVGLNTFWQTGSTSVLTGQRLIYSSPAIGGGVGAMPPNFIYDNAAAFGTEDGTDIGLTIPRALRGTSVEVTAGGSTTISTGVGSLKMSTANPATNAVWIPVKYAGVTYFVPGFTTNAP